MNISKPREDNSGSINYGRSEKTILTTPLSLVNRSGKKISAFLDHLPKADSISHVMILVPGYGKTKSSHLRVAYYLALNGSHVIRYDHSNHVGDSDGTILFTTLSQMEEDLASVIDFVEAKYPTTPIGVVAESLSARVALKRARNDQRLHFWVSLIGVFDVQQTLQRIYDEDGFIEKANGVVLGIRDIMGFQVDADRFIEDAYEHRFHSLETAVEDASQVKIPSVFFAAEKDPWVSQEAVRLVFDRCPLESKTLHLLPNLMHELYENPLVASDTFCKIVRTAKQWIEGKASDATLIQVPSEKTILSRSRLEKRGSSKDLKTAEERIFWAEYLEKYAYIIRLQDYWNLLDSIATNFGSWKKGEKILDAGCGTGNFGTFLLVRNLYHALQLRTASLKKKPWAQYVGVDFVDGALRQAKTVHQEISQEFGKKVDWATHGTAVIDFSYSVLDLDFMLPFRDQHFDKIVSNLVLSYVKDPLFTLSEMYRTLKVGGQVIISSLKPHADLSQIYRNYVSVSRSSEEMEQARMVLSNAGLIRYKEAEGFYQFFSESQIEELLRDVGCKNISVYRSFGDQANVAIGEKPSHY
jgi:ubiquinone/menaquinone biosynthesis C-methylase UbiE/alpha-beta hydrolase superfamily lysophospholipase